MNIALIPARGGSKRIPKKNIKPFLGNPIIGHVINILKDSGCFDRIIVSTDDEEIAGIAKAYGAEVPFMRPAKLADDYACTGVVIEHALNWLKENDQTPDYLCVVYPTAPLLTAAIIQDSFSQLRESESKKLCFGVARFSYPIQRSFRIDGNGVISMFQPEHLSSRSQDLEAAYHDAGQFYWGTIEGFTRSKGMFSEDAIPYMLPDYRVKDIDTLEDWDMAEVLYKVLEKSGK